MSYIVVAATSPVYLGSMGAMLDAHARLGEAFQSNDALGSYSAMQTQLFLVGATPGPIEAASGRVFVPDAKLATLTQPRLIYLPNFQLPDTAQFAASMGEYAPFYEWLQDQAQRGTAIGACGASVLHLAAAGLLTHMSCSASPRFVSVMRQISPRTKIDSESAIRHDGAIWTCRRDVDNAALVVRMIAACFSFALGQSLAMREPPGAAAEALAAAVDPILARAQFWIRDRFTQRFKIADLAAELGLSHQALIRRFAAAGIESPKHFLQNVRVEAAALMLTETSKSVAEIAQLVGYADAASFRRVFAGNKGMAPSAYRISMRHSAR